MNENDQAYIDGIEQACIARGIDSTEMVKEAQAASGTGTPEFRNAPSLAQRAVAPLARISPLMQYTGALRNSGVGRAVARGAAPLAQQGAAGLKSLTSAGVPPPLPSTPEFRNAPSMAARARNWFSRTHLPSRYANMLRNSNVGPMLGNVVGSMARRHPLAVGGRFIHDRML